MFDRYRLRLFGLPEAARDNEPVHGFQSRKALALLCYLAACSSDDETAFPLHRSHLAALFWSDKTEARGRANLSVSLHNLTTLFPGSVRADRHAVKLEPGTFWLDIRAFREFSDAGSASDLRAAAALYRGEFLTGIYLDDCPEFEVWLESERERWRRRMASVLMQLVGDHVRRGEYDAALIHTARLVELTPWLEAAHRRLMQLQLLTGQRSAALQQYETVRRVLARELDIEPEPETTALYQQIRAGQVDARALRATLEQVALG